MLLCSFEEVTPQNILLIIMKLSPHDILLIYRTSFYVVRNFFARRRSETPTAKARWVLNYSNFLYRPKFIYTNLFH